MPAKAITPEDLYWAQVAANYKPPIVFATPVTIAQEQPDFVPDNFDQLSPEEQERIKNRLRFRGIRLRTDLKDQTVPLTRETLDIP